MTHGSRLLLLALLAIASVAGAEEVQEVAPPANTETHLPTIPAPTPWVQDPEDLAADRGDRLVEREVLAEDVKTVKLRDVVPPIRFESGVAKIPPQTVAKLREVLAGMAHLHNVRLHLVGHADDQPLSEALTGVFGDNAGLSRERAGEVAEFIQRALALPPDAIAFEWAGDSQPVATNATAAGRALNRRVEVEVWYDELGSKLATEEVLVPQEWKRVKVCRTQTVCKLRYFEGHARRARIRNLIPPLRISDESVGVPEGFVRQVAHALENLEGKTNITVEFVGFTDDAPLTGRAETIYGTHEALSKARAHRVALAVQDALGLPSGAVVSDGLGAARPVASNQTERGRAANRRVEVEFWYDDALQELPEEPQPCPDDPGDEWVTRVYDPPWGAIPPLRLEDGEAVVPGGYAADLARALGDVASETNARLRFVGYTGNQPLDRRTAGVYGDDVGLSVARARRAMERIREDLELAPGQAEHEGRGFVHSNDVVNAGFLQGEDSFVVVEVVYDELARRDDLDGIEITPLVREFEPENPLGLNLMRITVDGEPLDDPGRSSADVQRCTDVALDRADIRFKFDNGEAEPRLSVTARPNAVAVPARPAPSDAVEAIHFRMYTNYGAFLTRAEVRVFAPGQSLDADPLGIAPVGTDGLAVWQPPLERFDGPVRELRYLLRAYGPGGQFDETETQPLWLFHPDAAEQATLAAAGSPTTPDVPPAVGPAERGLLAGYGESGLARRNIALGNVGRVHVDGSGIPPQHAVWLAGEPVPVDGTGRFVAETLLPAGTHTVELAVLDPDGNGELFLRDLEIERDDWFYVGVADLTLQANDTTGPADALVGDESPVDYDSAADGRLAFYVNGKFREDWGLVASADTLDGPVDQLFTNFVDKRPESLLRRIDPDYHYPTFGDDGTVEENAPTAGKFFVKLNKAKSHAMWGNFKVGYLDNELAQVDRGLYGANVHYESPEATKFGEQRLVVDGFAADPGTVPSREEFLGTGGSLYFLQHQDLLQGSERLRVELRDRDSGLVTSVVHLQPVLDYDIDYLQGRVLLTEPLSATVNSGLLVRTGGLSGNEAWLVVQYEFTPGFDEMDTLATGGQGQYWFNDSVKLGFTANENDQDEADSSLYATDLVVRRSTDTFFKLQAGRSEGLVSNSLFSQDGGFGFHTAPGLDLGEDSATALRGDVSVAFTDVVEGARGTLSLYAQDLGAGYSAPGMNAFTDTQQFGGLLRLPLSERLQLAAKADHLLQDQGLETSAQELDLGYRLTDQWSLHGGVRNEDRQDDSPIPLPTQEEGQRTDAAVQLAFDSLEKWRAYGFLQETVAKSGNREDNGRFGVGGAYRLSDRFQVDGEVSHGDLGPGVRLGTRYKATERSELYANYALENERTDNGLRSRGGSLVTGAKTRLSDSSSVYVERRDQHTNLLTGLTHASGITLAPTDRWNLGASADVGSLFDRQTGAEIKRRAGTARVGYGFDRVQLSSAFEYRFDETEQIDGTWSDRRTWLTRNTIKWETTPDWRFLGKLSWADSQSSFGDVYDGGYREAVVGYAYRPVKHDRLNALAKYTYFYNIPATDPFTIQTGVTQYLQQSHVASLDLTYDLTPSWTIGGKYAYRLGEVSLDRESPDFFDNNAHLGIVRADYRFLRNWEASLEGRVLDLSDLGDRRTGALIAIYRYLGDHFKVGVGYNFTDFSDDLTDLSYDHQGVFLNVIGTL